MDMGEVSTKSTKLEEVDLPQDMDLLNKWTIPKVELKTIYEYGFFDKIKHKQIIKTTEQSLALNADEQTIQLLNKHDIDIFKRNYNYMHIGLVQIAFRPLTLKGLPETFLAALRDARNLNFRKSLMGSIESTLAYGPVYFNTQPNLQLSLTDVNILHALTLNVKTHGYDYAPGSELIGLSYRIYYRLLSTLNPRCKLIDDNSDCTMLIETNFIKSRVTTRRPIRWDEIDFPQAWILNSVTSPKQLAEDVTNSELTQVTQNPDGRICLQFDSNPPVYRNSFSIPRRLPSIHHISPIEPDYGPARNRAASLHTINSADSHITPKGVEKIKINSKTNIVQDFDNENPTPSEMDFDINSV